MNDFILYEKEKNKLGFSEVFPVKLLSNKNFKNLNKNTLNIARGSEKNREFLESKHSDILLDPHLNEVNLGINHILCKIAKDKIIAFSFSNILNSKNKELEISKIKKIVKLCNKYKVKIIFASFAQKESERRNASQLKALARILGINSKQKFNPEKYLKEKKAIVIKGIKRVE